MNTDTTFKAKEEVKELMFRQGIGDFGIGVSQDGSDYVVRVYLYDPSTSPILPDKVNGIRVVIVRSKGPCFACD